MKKMKTSAFFLFATLAFLSLNMNAQTSDSNQSSNFVRVDPIRFLGSLALYGGIEHALNPASSIGAEILLNARNHEWVGKNHVGVFGRFYFDSANQAYISGFYAELFSNVAQWEVLDKEVTDLSVGFGGGYKYALSNKLGIDLNGGFGRFLFAGEDKLDWKLSLCLGWSF